MATKSKATKTTPSAGQPLQVYVVRKWATEPQSNGQPSRTWRFVEDQLFLDPDDAHRHLVEWMQKTSPMFVALKRRKRAELLALAGNLVDARTTKAFASVRRSVMADRA